MRHTIEFKESALRTLEGLDKPIRVRIARRIGALADEPRPAAATVLKGGDGDLRIRVGDYRIVYRVDGQKLIILIIRIGHRSEVYRNRCGDSRFDSPAGWARVYLYRPQRRRGDA